MKIAGQAIPHESAREHVTGDALYTDDLVLRFPRVLHAWPVLAPHAHALVKALDAVGGSIRTGRRHGSYRQRMFPARATRDRIVTMNRFSRAK